MFIYLYTVHLISLKKRGGALRLYPAQFKGTEEIKYNKRVAQSDYEQN